MTHFSVYEIPFSYFGSWLNLSRVIGNATYADDVHLVSHQAGLHPVLRLTPRVNGQAVKTMVDAIPSALTWRHGKASIDAAFESVDTLRIRGTGLGVALVAADTALTPFSGPYFFRDPRDGAFVFTLYETGRRYRITVLSGLVDQSMGAEELGDTPRGVELSSDTPWEVAIEEYGTSRAAYRKTISFHEVVGASGAAFTAFADAVAPFRGPDFPAADLAAYTMWSATVRPLGFITRPSVLMSKHWMDKVWSWDHCFNALALAHGLPDLAWDQFQSVFDHQESSGGLPDSVTHSEILYNFVKPPIHGWAFRVLRRRMPRALTEDELRLTYQRLAAWTTFWLDHRRAPGHDLPHYQHGNDSGWDNATTFANERLVETADLTSFLILQLEVLAELASELRDGAAADHWASTARDLHAAMLDQLWDGEQFRARSVASGEMWTSASLLDLMPIVLGDALPTGVSNPLAHRLEAQLTSIGLATEHAQSELYEPDGYWRGPVWAPSTVLAEDGLRRAGHVRLADEISARFRTVCEKSGFAENFDALTGAGLRDRAYTWTASAYLLLCAQAHERAPRI